MFSSVREKTKDHISLKEAAELSGYTPDYLGQLIRKGKLEGYQVYSSVAWVTTHKAILEYKEASAKNGKKKPRFRLPGVESPVVKWILYIVILVLALLNIFFLYILIAGIENTAHTAVIQQVSGDVVSDNAYE